MILAYAEGRGSDLSEDEREEFDECVNENSGQATGGEQQAAPEEMILKFNCSVLRCTKLVAGLSLGDLSGHVFGGLSATLWF